MKKNTLTSEELRTVAAELRMKVIELSHKLKIAHLGSALSCIDIMAVLYWNVMKINPSAPGDESRDRFLLSKGHAALAWYATLAKAGFFPESMLDSTGKKGSILEEHPGWNKVPGIEAASGSLGHCLAIASGMALASKIRKTPYRCFVLMGDGECNEGSVWESAMFAAGKGLDNLTAIVDFNKWQATDRSCEVLALEPLKEKWKSFGWSVYEIDGHSIEELSSILSNTPDGSGKPVAVIANTVKGKGVSFMEDDNNWHYRIPTEEEVLKAKKELFDK